MKTRSKYRKKQRLTRKKKSNKKRRYKRGGYNDGDAVSTKDFFNYIMNKIMAIMESLRKMNSSLKN